MRTSDVDSTLKDINDETIHHIIKNLNDKLLKQAKVIQYYKILPGLKESKSQVGINYQ